MVPAERRKPRDPPDEVLPALRLWNQEHVNCSLSKEGETKIVGPADGIQTSRGASDVHQADFVRKLI